MSHIEKRGPGRWRARYRGPDGRERSHTFDRKVDAERWLAQTDTQKARGIWVDPAAGRVSFGAWFTEWLDTLTVRPSTHALYQYLANRCLFPTFEHIELAKISSTDVRHWYAAMSAGGDLSPNTVAKAYRLLVRVMNVAVDDAVIGRSPCTLKGAGTERSPEMHFAGVEQIHSIADAIEPHYRALVLTAAFAGLRFGELAGLRRRRVDLLHRTVTVAQQLTEINGHLEFAAPKTDAGQRVVAVPAFLASELETHLANFAEPDADGLVFPAPDGGLMRRSNFRRRVWLPALKSAGIEGLRFHDLRHSAGTLAAHAGATTKELMARLGHESPRAALIYQHATADRDVAIATALDALAASPRPEEQEAPPNKVTRML